MSTGYAMHALAALSSLLVVGVGSLSFTANAQQSVPEMSKAELATELSESRANNHELMREYSWTCRTEVKIKGQQKVLKSEAVHYETDGLRESVERN